MATDFHAQSPTPHPNAMQPKSEALSTPAIASRLDWLRFLSDCDRSAAFISGLHEALGYRPGVLVAPEMVLRTIQVMRRQNEEVQAELRARALQQLDGGGILMFHFDFHIGDYDQATAHLDMIRDGCYLRLIRKYYAEEKPLPSDVGAVQRLVRAFSDEEKSAVISVLNEYFFLEEDGWHSKRCDAEIKSYRYICRINRKIAKERERTKRARSVDDPCKKREPNHEPVTSNREPSSGAPANTPPSAGGKPADSEKSTRKPNPVWDSIAALFFNGDVAAPDRPRVGKIVRDLNAHGATPAEIEARLAAMKREWPNVSHTPEALVKHWVRFGVQTQAIDPAMEEKFCRKFYGGERIDLAPHEAPIFKEWVRGAKPQKQVSQ